MQIDLSLYDATLIPAIVFLVYLTGKFGVPRKFLPAAALVLSITAALVFISQSPEGVLIGILLAANVVGFHSGSKNLWQAIFGQQQQPDVEDLIGEEVAIPGLAGTYVVTSVAQDGAIQIRQVTGSGL